MKARKALNRQGIRVSAAWRRDSDSRWTALWFVTWTRVHGSCVAGAYAGWSESLRGMYLADCFMARVDGQRVLWARVLDQESASPKAVLAAARPATMPDSETLAVAEAAQAGWQSVWQWNDFDVWCDSDHVALRKDRTRRVVRDEDGDYVLGASVNRRLVRELCTGLGLRYGP